MLNILFRSEYFIYVLKNFLDNKIYYDPTNYLFNLLEIRT